ncbi:MAG: hypothetical protein HY904_13955 [Deltaproteobacteria bacterium]|nr:hypothetical protein [Deltaproteobacteria bacterium]
MAAAKEPIDLVVTLKYASMEEFEAGFAPCVGRETVFFRTRQVRPVGTRVRLELRLRDGFPALVVQGPVLWSVGPELVPRGRTAGMGLQASGTDEISGRRLQAILAARGEGALAQPPGMVAWEGFKARFPEAVAALSATGARAAGGVDALHRDLDDAFRSILTGDDEETAPAILAPPPLAERTAGALVDALRQTGRDATVTPPLSPPREPDAGERAGRVEFRALSAGTLGTAPERDWRHIMATPDLPKPPPLRSGPGPVPPPPLRAAPSPDPAPRRTPPPAPAVEPPRTPPPPPAPVVARVPPPAPVPPAVLPPPAPEPAAPAEPDLLSDAEADLVEDAPALAALSAPAPAPTVTPEVAPEPPAPQPPPVAQPPEPPLAWGATDVDHPLPARAAPPPPAVPSRPAAPAREPPPAEAPPPMPMPGLPPALFGDDATQPGVVPLLTASQTAPTEAWSRFLSGAHAAWTAHVVAAGAERRPVGWQFTMGYDPKAGADAPMALEQVFWPAGARTRRELPVPMVEEPAAAPPPVDGPPRATLGPPPLRRATAEVPKAGADNPWGGSSPSPPPMPMPLAAVPEEDVFASAPPAAAAAGEEEVFAPATPPPAEVSPPPPPPAPAPEPPAVASAPPEDVFSPAPPPAAPPAAITEPVDDGGVFASPAQPPAPLEEAPAAAPVQAAEEPPAPPPALEDAPAPSPPAPPQAEPPPPVAESQPPPAPEAPAPPAEDAARPEGVQIAEPVDAEGLGHLEDATHAQPAAPAVAAAETPSLPPPPEPEPEPEPAALPVVAAPPPEPEPAPLPPPVDEPTTDHGMPAVPEHLLTGETDDGPTELCAVPAAAEPPAPSPAPPAAAAPPEDAWSTSFVWAPQVPAVPLAEGDGASLTALRPPPATAERAVSALQDGMQALAAEDSAFQDEGTGRRAAVDPAAFDAGAEVTAISDRPDVFADAPPPAPVPPAPAASAEVTAISMRPDLDEATEAQAPAPAPARPAAHPGPAALVMGIGIGLPGGRVRVLIPAATALPARWQKGVPGARVTGMLEMDLHESSSERSADGHHLGKLAFKPREKAHGDEWLVELEVDADAVLRVEAHPVRDATFRYERLFALDNTTAKGRARVARAQPKDPEGGGGGFMRRLIGR